MCGIPGLCEWQGCRRPAKEKSRSPLPQPQLQPLDTHLTDTWIKAAIRTNFAFIGSVRVFGTAGMFVSNRRNLESGDLPRGNVADLTGGAFQATDPQFPSKGPQHSSFYPVCLSGQRERTGGCSLNRDFETYPHPLFTTFVLNLLTSQCLASFCICLPICFKPK